MSEILRINTISQFHEILGLPAPAHPLITLIHDKDNKKIEEMDDSLFDIRFSSDLFNIMFKDKIIGSMGYGRNSYDYEEGTMIFASPGQVFTSPKKEDLKGKEGWTLLFHPDLLLKSSLSDKMDSYTYFSYEVSEALHLSEKEQLFVAQVIEQIQTEYSANLDKHSQGLILSNLELLLNYCMRFYDRQFITRTNFNSDFIVQFETELKSYFKSEVIREKGIPGANYFGERINMSTNYLSDLLKKETGKGIKEHIDTYIIKRAKSALLNSPLSVSEIAFDLGFDYPQSFTRLFKKKIGMSPIEYRNLN